MCVTNAVGDSTDWHDDYFTNYLFCVPQSNTDGGNVLWKPRPLTNTPDYKTARAWLNDCQAHHSTGCDHSDPPKIQGLHLIDVFESRVVAPDDSVDLRWIALSYVWGQSPPLEMTGMGRLPDKLPRTIEDAITATKNLNYRYLWIDEICIDQQDPVHRADQISKMDQIYRGADLTIVAAAGGNKDHGLPGVSTTPRVKHPVFNWDQGTIFDFGPDPLGSVESSIWWRRAWTFQEGQLSRRLLVFTDHQMVFYCNTSAWMEVLGGPPSAENGSILVPPVKANLWDFYSSSENDVDSPHEKLINFGILITNYTDRNISFASDALKAASGVLSRLQEENDPAYNFAGLPYYRGSGDKMPLIPIEQAIGHALSWHTFDTPLSRREIFPSWTWAGWSGRVKWKQRNVSQDHIPLRHVRLENQASEIIILPEQPNATSGPDLQRTLSTVVAVMFEAPVIPATYDAGEYTWNLGKWLPPDIDKFLLPNLQQGLWSCFVLFKSEEDSREYAVLLCRWIDGQSAERLACFMMGLAEEEVRLFETRKVRLL
ncbi:heterokaryon incompatibility protein-domain-containing protein [Phaeosphaeria sp. MPI-PUGE-AT-0046c]|nr:heterokaryon incompatibility protein-domain-containing protein [Phaeosphaeria sp. MPI-PUGE-AT-0046c]